MSAELESSKKEAARLKNQLASVNSDVEQMKVRDLCDDIVQFYGKRVGC